MRIKTDEELWELLGSVDKFNTFLSEFEANVKRQMILLVPDLVLKHIQDQYKYKELVSKFYEAHPELVEDKALVGHLTNKVAAEHPDWDIEQIFSHSAEMAKAIIGDRHAQEVRTNRNKRRKV